MPSSSYVRRAAAAKGASPGYGWPQQVLDQTPGEWYLPSARRWSSSRPCSSKRNTENARCSWPGAWWAASFSAVPMVVPFSSTSSSMIASAAPFDEVFAAVAGVVGIPILRYGPAPCAGPVESAQVCRTKAACPYFGSWHVRLRRTVGEVRGRTVRQTPKAAGYSIVPCGTGAESSRTRAIIASSGTSKPGRIPYREAGTKPNLG